MRTKKGLALLGVFLILASVARSSDPYQEQMRTRENITTLLLLRMTQALDLSEEQTAQIFPAVNRIEKEKRRLNRDLVQHMRELREMLQEGEYSEDQLVERITAIKDLRMAVKSREAEFEEFIESALTVEQQAKFLIFFQDFYRRLRQHLEEARQMRQKQRKQLPIRN
jgi:Spy/CpxP family protein refolding chaperone